MMAAQGALVRTSEWVQSLFTPPEPLPPQPQSADTSIARLSARQPAAEADISAQVLSHRSTTRGLKRESQQLSDDIAQLRKCATADALDGARCEVVAVGHRTHPRPS